MNILLCNDDGIESLGLISLAKQLSKNNSLLVVAPKYNCSAMSHSLTIEKELILTKENIKGCKAYSITGTPVDCVKFAFLHFNTFNADIVVAGLNNAHNIGSDILYSGTVSICYEASFFNKISFAFSLYNRVVKDYDKYAVLAEKIINFLLPYSNNGDIWNINFPDENLEIKGAKITSLGKNLYSDRYEKIGENKYKLTGEVISHNENLEDCDIEWLKKGYITITPLVYDKTNFTKVEKVKNLCIKL
ncbi:MAG: 5'/3'-nucleotidase SurE [Clostridia bacterium]|nr:5'/3'-nucleotidase SurE [Clostridia bacterium]